ncbi:MAG: hypothetical protein EZS28_051853, partial [Streblomastix strix]
MIEKFINEDVTQLLNQCLQSYHSLSGGTRRSSRTFRFSNQKNEKWCDSDYRCEQNGIWSCTESESIRMAASINMKKAEKTSIQQLKRSESNLLCIKEVQTVAISSRLINDLYRQLRCCYESQKESFCSFICNNNEENLSRSDVVEPNNSLRTYQRSRQQGSGRSKSIGIGRGLPYKTKIPYNNPPITRSHSTVRYVCNKEERQMQDLLLSNAGRLNCRDGRTSSNLIKYSYTSQSPTDTNGPSHLEAANSEQLHCGSDINGMTESM